MTSDPPSRKRPLTADEAELWLFAMRQAKALQRRGRERRKAEALRIGTDDAAAPAHAPAVAESREGNAATPSSPSADARGNGARTKASPPPLSQFDERQRRKLAKDVGLIDARLDLHGMRQREAHRALTSFLGNCAARGLRHVLVITGKGAPDTAGTRDFYGEERGVLRRLVPLWLSEPELRGVVVSYTTSHVRHGGEGALYVRLRRAPGGNNQP